MKNKFFRKVFLGLVLVVMFSLFVSGCGVSIPTLLTTPTIPTTCTIIVTDETNSILGNVYLDGTQVPGGMMYPGGTVQIDNVTIGVQHEIYIVETLLTPALSHSEYITPTAGTNYVHFYEF